MDCGRWMTANQGAPGRNLQSLYKSWLVRSQWPEEESVKCSESKSIEYLTVSEQEESWDRIFYYCIKAEIQHVQWYKVHID